MINSWNAFLLAIILKADACLVRRWKSAPSYSQTAICKCQFIIFFEYVCVYYLPSNFHDREFVAHWGQMIPIKMHILGPCLRWPIFFFFLIESSFIDHFTVIDNDTKRRANFSEIGKTWLYALVKNCWAASFLQTGAWKDLPWRIWYFARPSHYHNFYNRPLNLKPHHEFIESA